MEDSVCHGVNNRAAHVEMIYFNSKHLYTAYGWRSAAHARDHGWPLFLADLLHQSIGRAIWTIGVRLGVGPVIRFEVSDVLDVFSANRAVVKRVVIRARHHAGVVGECCHDAAWSVLRGVQGRKSSARAPGQPRGAHVHSHGRRGPVARLPVRANPRQETHEDIANCVALMQEITVVVASLGNVDT